MMVSKRSRNSSPRMLISLESNSQEPRMPKSLMLRLKLHAESPIQTSSHGGGIFADSLNLPESSGVDAASLLAKRRKKSLMMTMRSIFSVRILKRISKLKRNLRS
jgi:hypothetical protein